MTLKLTNSLGRHKQDFTPLNPDHITMYVCGPTVYNYAHIGNARPAVAFDVLRRLLAHIYPRVTFVSNITDIDDKIMNASKETGESIRSITDKFTEIYNADMAALGVMAPDHQPRATETLPEMIDLIEKLIARGHAYEAEGHVLFNVPSYDDYGQLSGRSRDDQIAGARVEVAPFKRDPADFVLWKPSTDDQPGWNSPWGRGRPGWHIECSAMSEKFLGKDFDIHGGGLDLTFPHHENEIAQSVCAHGTSKFARYWIHNGFLTVEGEKMSKSIGNVLLVHDIVKDAPGEAVRFALLAAHYRQPFDWSAKGLDEATKTLSKFYELIDSRGAEDGAVDPEFLDALLDDLNTPKAIAVLHGLARDGRIADLKASAALMGVLQQDPKVWASHFKADIDRNAAQGLIDARAAARANKDWAESDRLRGALESMGVGVKDSRDGSDYTF